MTRKHEVEASKQLLSRLGLERLERPCPGCGVTLVYKTVKGFEYSVKQNAGCSSCGRIKIGVTPPDDLTRPCPRCASLIVYKSKQSWRQAHKAGRLCRPCATEATRATTGSEEWRAWRSEAYKGIIDSGEAGGVRDAYEAMQNAAARTGGVSKLEAAFVEALGPFGYAPGKVGRWRCDAVNHGLKAVVEVHGDWWHVRPGSRWESLIRVRYGGVHPRSKLTIEAIRERDGSKAAAVGALGYAYTVVWESDVDEWMTLIRESLASLAPSGRMTP